MSDRRRPPSLRTVIAASSAGTAFEFYDFLIFGSLAGILAKAFFSGVDETLGFILALGAFGAGFVARPLGGLVFGRWGDKAGRKGAFLVTIVVMGVATFLIGLLPTYAMAGPIAPILLVTLRVVQGFALGGEYGGAAIYVAEHAPAEKRGWVTSWIQTSAGFGLLGALVVIFTTRSILGEAAFTEWGWRIPFMVSAGLVGVSIWIRLKLDESPLFQEMRAQGKTAERPLAETFLQWSNLKLVLLAFFGFMAAQGAVFYTGFFYAQFFLERVLKAPALTINLLMMVGALASAGFYLLFGWLSDRVGRKPVMLTGMVIAAVGFFPAFYALTRATNPALAEASARAPVFVMADPAECSVQFDPVGKAGPGSPCDVAKAALTRAGVPYENRAAPAGVVTIQVGAVALPAPATTPPKDLEAQIGTLLQAAGYPTAADPARINLPVVTAILILFVIAATALYGPLAAALVELFPTRIRYTALALPYHIGSGWIGGFMPATAFATVAATGDIYAGLWYPVGLSILSILVTIFLMPETRGKPLNAS